MSKVGTALANLEARLTDVAGFKTSAFLEFDGYLTEVRFTVDSCGRFIRAYLMAGPGSVGFSHAGADSIKDALLQLTAWCPDSKLLVDTIIVQSTEDTENISVTACAVWCEAFPLHIKIEDASTSDAEEHRKNAIAMRLQPLLRGGSQGISKWNRFRGQNLVDWRHSNLTETRLKGADLRELDWQHSNFDNAKMDTCNLSSADVSNASLQGASLTKSNLTDCQANHTNFANAMLTGANLSGSDLCHAILTNCDLSKAKLKQALLYGVDLSTCKIDLKTDFCAAKYDETTKLPADFPQWRQLIWRGSGPDPYKAMIDALLASSTEIQFEDFLQYLHLNFDSSKLQKAVSMLKKERFSFFRKLLPITSWR